MVRRVDPHDENHGMVQRVFGLCAVANATEVDEPLQARTQRHEIVPKMLNIIINIEKEGCQTEARKDGWWKGKKVTRRKCKRLEEEFDVGGFMA